MKTDYETYKKLREEGWSPTTAAKGRRVVTQRTFDWKPSRRQHVIEEAIWSEDGYDLRASVMYEDDPDLSYLGEFTDKWSPNAIKRRNPGWRECKYWVPANTYEDHYRGLRAMNFDKHTSDCLARKYVANDLRRHETYGDNWGQYVVVVTAHRYNKEVGDAGIGGVELDSLADAYLEEVTNDLADEALDSAERYYRPLVAEAL